MSKDTDKLVEQLREMGVEHCDETFSSEIVHIKLDTIMELLIEILAMASGVLAANGLEEVGEKVQDSYANIMVKREKQVQNVIKAYLDRVKSN